MKSYLKIIIKYRFLVLFLLISITIVFGFITSRGIIASSMGNLFFGEDHPGYKEYRKRIRQFANDEVFIIAYEDPNPFSPERIQRLGRAVERINEIPDIGRVDSLLNVQHIFANDDILFVKKYAKEVLDHPATTGASLNLLKTDPLVSGLLISRDGCHSAVIIELEPDESRPAERGPHVVETVLKIFEECGFERTNLHRVGFMASLAEVMSQTRFNFFRLFPFVCLVLLITLYILFHRIWPVFITLAVSLMAVIWTFGFSVLIDPKINIFIGLSPALILIVATSDVIHLCSAYMLELSQGKEKEEAILSSGFEVGTACIMTSATTFVGFVSMSFIPVPAIQQLGLVIGFGVAVALLLAMTLAPILFFILKKPKPWHEEVSGTQRILSFALRGVEQLSIRRPWFIVFFFAILFCFSVFGIFNLNIETELNKRFDDDNQIRIDETYFNDHFVGTNFLEIFLDTPKKEGVLNPVTFSKVSDFQAKLEHIEQVDKVVSLVDLVKMIDRALNPERRGKKAIPLTRQLLAQYLLLFEMSGGEDLDRFVDHDRSTIRMAVRLSDNRVRATRELADEVKEMARGSFKGHAEIHATGITYLMGTFLDEIIAGQRTGMIVAFTVIMVLMIIWMRSFRVGIWSMIPNILPILALGGYLGLFWNEVDSDTLPIAMIAIGIGVDNTIHFLMRLRFETRRTANTLAALNRTFHFTGRAILITTLILVAGFSPFAISDYFSIRIMGTLIPLTLLVALLADLFLASALVKLGAIRFPHVKQTDPGLKA